MCVKLDTLHEQYLNEIFGDYCLRTLDPAINNLKVVFFLAFLKNLHT